MRCAAESELLVHAGRMVEEPQAHEGYGSPRVLRGVGYWSSSEEPDLPRPEDLVAPGWNPDDRDAVIGYLEQGFPFTYAMGPSFCRICGKPNGSQDLTDGAFAWPEGLSHYLRDHSVRLPDQLVSAFLARAAELEEGGFETSWWISITPAPG